jgi:hypothetical protein
MRPGDPELREGWSIEAPDSPHPLGAKYTRDDNVVGQCCSAGVYREEDARLICAAPMMLETLEWLDRVDGLGPDVRERIKGALKFARQSKRVEVKGVCEGCGRPVPAGFYECGGDGSHPQKD